MVKSSDIPMKSHPDALPILSLADPFLDNPQALDHHSRLRPLNIRNSAQLYHADDDHYDAAIRLKSET